MASVNLTKISHGLSFWLDSCLASLEKIKRGERLEEKQSTTLTEYQEFLENIKKSIAWISGKTEKVYFQELLGIFYQCAEKVGIKTSPALESSIDAWSKILADRSVEDMENFKKLVDLTKELHVVVSLKLYASHCQNDD